MAEPLGKLGKPDISNYRDKRKIYLVPLIFQGSNSPEEYTEKFDLYWRQVDDHINNLEIRIGKADHVYHEAIAFEDDDALNILEKYSPKTHEITLDRCRRGATLESTEDKILCDESADWERCLMMGLISEKAAKMISELYVDVSRKRYEHINSRIDQTLKDGEAGILFIREGHMVQFPQDIEVFSIAPPVLDDIHRWYREQRTSATA